MSKTVDPFELPARCETRCDHGSQCTGIAGHDGYKGHLTEHNCICYDIKIPVDARKTAKQP